MIILTLMTAWLFALYDSHILNSGKYINNHNSRFLIRAITVLCFSLLYCFILQKDFISFVYIFTGSSLLFAATFDGFLNQLRGKDVFFLGSTAKWDIFWTRHFVAYGAFRVVGLLLGVLLIFKN